MYYIGIDIGGTNIKAAMVARDGTILEKYTIKTPKNLIAFYEGLQHCIYRVTQKSGTTTGKIVGIGVGIPGNVDKDGMVYNFVNLGIEREALGEKLSKLYTGAKVRIANDAYVAGLAEHEFGALKDCRNAILLTLGTGIGSSLVLNGSLYTSTQGFTPECGHMSIRKNDFDCNCGNNGCFETFCSATGFTKQAILFLEKNTLNTSLRPSGLSPIQILEAYAQGDAAAVRITDRFVEDLSIGIGNLINMFLPDKVALGGGFSKGLSPLLKKIEEKSNAKALNKFKQKTSVVRAELLNDAGVVGAAMLNL